MKIRTSINNSYDVTIITYEKYVWETFTKIYISGEVRENECYIEFGLCKSNGDTRYKCMEIDLLLSDDLINERFQSILNVIDTFYLTKNNYNEILNRINDTIAKCKDIKSTMFR